MNTTCNRARPAHASIGPITLRPHGRLTEYDWVSTEDFLHAGSHVGAALGA